jgi:hypothetical protein
MVIISGEASGGSLELTRWRKRISKRRPHWRGARRRRSRMRKR